MFSFPGQFSASGKAGVEAQLAMFSALASKTIEGMEKLVDLNIGIVKASMEESAQTVKRMMAVKDPQELLSTGANPAGAEKALNYGRSLLGIVSSTQAELTRIAETEMTDAHRKVLALVEELTKNAPPGSENLVELAKSSVGNMNAGYEQMSKAHKQLFETVESNVNASIKQFSQATEKVVPKSTRK